MRYEVIVPARFHGEFVRSIANRHNLVEVVTSGYNKIYVFANEDDQEKFEVWFLKFTRVIEG